MDPVPNGTVPDRIDTTVRAGESRPVFRGTQVSVDEVLRKLAARQSWDSILDAHSVLTSDDLAAAVEYERALIRRWVEQWAVTGPLLEEIKRSEFRAMSDDDHRRAMAAVLSISIPRGDPSQTTGLVEIQRWLRENGLMDPLLVAALELQAFCDARGWRCCVIGGLALLRWGRSRATEDVDLSLLTGVGGETAYIDAALIGSLRILLAAFIASRAGKAN